MVRGLLPGIVVAAFACTPTPPPLTPDPAPLEVMPIATTPERGGPSVVESSSGPPSEAERALQDWSEQSQCDAYDYYPKGGLQSFWCHRPGRITLAAVRAMAGVDVFAAGPHSRDALKLDAPGEFGRYNPAFVKWLVEKSAASPRGSPAQIATQAAYDAKLKPLADIFFRTYQKAKSEPDCFARERRAYEELIARKRLPRDYYERWFWFMNPYFCTRGVKAGDNFYYDNAFDAGVDGNVTKTVVGFWLRRSLDGTIDSFADGMKKLVAAYDPELAETKYVAVDSLALTRTLDAGVKTAAACPQKVPRVDLVVSPDGSVLVEMRGRQAAAVPPCVGLAFAALHVQPFSGHELHFSRALK